MTFISHINLIKFTAILSYIGALVIYGFYNGYPLIDCECYYKLYTSVGGIGVIILIDIIYVYQMSDDYYTINKNKIYISPNQDKNKNKIYISPNQDQDHYIPTDQNCTSDNYTSYLYYYSLIVTNLLYITTTVLITMFELKCAWMLIGFLLLGFLFMFLKKKKPDGVGVSSDAGNTLPYFFPNEEPIYNEDHIFNEVPPIYNEEHIFYEIK